MMYNNPYMNNYGFMPMQQERQQPIQNIINTQPQANNDMFMARFLKQGEKPEDIFVNQQTAFIDLNNKKLSIKELDGKMTSYEIILPKDEKDLKIELLEKQISDLKEMMTSGYENVPASDEITQQTSNGKKSNRK